MKLAALFGTVAMAGKADPRAKSGRTKVSNDRFVWKTPRCLAIPELCDSTCHKTINSSFGNITITPEDYTANKNCLWTIDIPADRTLSLKFVDEFDLEWHQNCAYDKVHILDGSDNLPIGRFCGPKQDNSKNGGKPWDGTRKNKPGKWTGKLAFWDKWFDTNTHKVLIGFDTDQSSSDFAGFTLKWISEKIPDADLMNFNQAMDYVKTNLNKAINKKDLVGNGNLHLKNAVERIFENAIAAVEKDRNCAKDINALVSDQVFKNLKDMHDGNKVIVRNFPNYTDRLRELVLDYIGTCVKATDHWTRRTEKLVEKWHDELDKMNARK